MLTRGEGKTSKKIGAIAIIVIAIIIGGVAYFLLESKPEAQPPTADFTYSPSEPNPDETVSFDASTSSDPDGIIVSYDWFFGDEATGTGETTTHSYSEIGDYTVTLTVEDNDGATDSTSKTVTVVSPSVNQSPTADFTFSPTSPWIEETVTFDASKSSDPDGEIVSYEWKFGKYEGGGTGMNVDYVYLLFGLYEVTLTVTDDGGLSDNVTKEVKVIGSVYEGPVAKFTYSPSSPSVGENVTFDPSASEISYPSGWWGENIRWDFGDNTTCSTLDTVEVTHSYSSPGEYEVTLTVVQNDYQTDNVTKTVIVS